MEKNLRLKNFPVSFFSVVMGLAGFTIVLEKAENIFQWSFHLSAVALIVTSVVFLGILAVYSLKTLKFFSVVREEFNHPIKINFFPTFSISFLLSSIAFLEINPTFSRYLWIFGMATHFLLTLKIITAWIWHRHFEIKHMNPAWFIPAVGNILIPIAGVAHFSKEFSWFFFSVGFFFWIILLVILFYRIFFREALPEKLLPTMFIIIAPPSVGFISYVKLAGAVDSFAKMLYYFGLFLVLLLFYQAPLFARVKFYLSFWAYSFPLAAISIASALMFQVTKNNFFLYVYGILTISLSILIVYLSAVTLVAIKKRMICVEE